MRQRQNRLKIKSTLPQLFTQHKNLKQSKNTPRKQGGIFSLDLGKKQQNKLISPAKHGIQTLGIASKKLSDVLNQTFYSTRYSSSLGKPKYKQQKIQSISFSMTHRQFPLQAKRNTIIQIRQRSPVNKDTINDIQNFKQHMKRIQSDVITLSHAVNRQNNFQQQIRAQHNQLKQRWQNEISFLDQKFKDIIKDTWQMLSILRRQTGMQQKMSKKDIGQINRQFVDMIQIIQQLEGKRVNINKHYFN